MQTIKVATTVSLSPRNNSFDKSPLSRNRRPSVALHGCRRTKRGRSRTAQLASSGILFNVPFSATRSSTAGPLNPLRSRREGRREGRRRDNPAGTTEGSRGRTDCVLDAVSEGCRRRQPSARFCTKPSARVIVLLCSPPRPSTFPGGFRCVQAFASRDCTVMMIISM